MDLLVLQQVVDAVVVDLLDREVHLVLPLVLSVLFDLREQLLDAPLDDPSIRALLFGCLVVFLGPYQRMGFAAARLPVREDAYVFAVDRALHELLEFSKNAVVVVLRREYLVESVEEVSGLIGGLFEFGGYGELERVGAANFHVVVLAFAGGPDAAVDADVALLLLQLIVEPLSEVEVLLRLDQRLLILLLFHLLLLL